MKLARRDLLAQRLGAALSILVVALPVTLAVAVSMVEHNSREDGELLARKAMGDADALLRVTRFPKIRVAYDYQDSILVEPARRRATRETWHRPKDAPSLDLELLLPDGSVITPAAVLGSATLAAGGDTQVVLVDVDDPLVSSQIALEGGHAPSRADEAAISTPMADEFGLLTEAQRLRPDSSVVLSSGRRLQVVGLVRLVLSDEANSTPLIVAAPDSDLVRAPLEPEYLVDLPPMSLAELRSLALALADRGIALLPRGVFTDPATWGVRSSSTVADPQAIASGSLVIAGCVVVVMLLVGAAIAISARRSIRDLGLVVAIGAAPRDVGRLMLAKGLAIGATGSLIGAIVGIGAFFVSANELQYLVGRPIWDSEVDWLTTCWLVVLGTLSAVAAAVYPAVSAARATAVEALAGKYAHQRSTGQRSRLAQFAPAAGTAMIVGASIWIAASGGGCPEFRGTSVAVR